MSVELLDNWVVVLATDGSIGLMGGIASWDIGYPLAAKPKEAAGREPCLKRHILSLTTVKGQDLAQCPCIPQEKHPPKDDTPEKANFLTDKQHPSLQNLDRQHPPHRFHRS